MTIRTCPCYYGQRPEYCPIHRQQEIPAPRLGQDRHHKQMFDLVFAELEADLQLWRSAHHAGDVWPDSEVLESIFREAVEQLRELGEQ